MAEGTELVDRMVASELDLLSRNVEILERLGDKNPLGIIRLSEALRLPIHKVRYSLHLLEREGVIQPSADGAVLTDKARQFWMPARRIARPDGRAVQQLKQKASAHQGKPPAGSERLLDGSSVGATGAAVAQRQSDRLLTERSAVQRSGRLRARAEIPLGGASAPRWARSLAPAQSDRLITGRSSVQIRLGP